MRFGSLLVLLLVTGVTMSVAQGATHCQAAAVIDSPFIQASLLATDRFVFLKHKIGTGATAEIFNCSGPGLTWHVLEVVGDDLASTCHQQKIYNPAGLNATTQKNMCVEGAFESNPWACLPGDWSGKFGRLQTISLIRGTRAQASLLPFFGGKEEAPTENTVTDAFQPEDLRVFEDPLPIPACTLINQALSFNCADGRIAGCSFFKPLLPLGTQFSKAQIMEAGVKFLLYADRKGVSGGLRSDRNENDKSWTDKFRSSDYWNHLWDDVKKKSRNFWDL